MKRTCLIIVFVFMLILTGCAEHYNTKKISEDKSKKILNYLQDEDSEGLKKMFCQKVKNTEDLDSQIEDAFDFFDGKVISHDNILSNESQTVKKGEVTYLYISPRIENIKTDSTKTYNIYVCYYVVNINNKDLEGLSKIIIEDNSYCSVTIGYDVE